MTRFLSAAHLTSWAGVAPAVDESAGRHRAAGTRNRNKWLTAMLGEGALMKGDNLGADDQARLRR